MEDNYIIAPVVHEDGVDKVYEPIVKITDTLPIGTEVDYDGENIPSGWEEIDSLNSKYVNVGTDIDNNYTTNILYSDNIFGAIPSTQTKNGITLTNNGDGTFNLVGTATAQAEFIWWKNYTEFESKMKQNAPWRSYVNKSSDNVIYQISTWTGTTSNPVWSSTPIQFTQTQTNKIISTGTFGPLVRFNIQVNKGATINLTNIQVSLVLTDRAITYNKYLDYSSININGEEIYNQNVMNYSTTEQVVGKWTDGKPLYRSIINFTISVDTGTYFGTYTGSANLIKSIDTLVDYKFYVYKGTLIFPVPNGGGNNNNRDSGIYIQRSYGGIGLQCSANSFDNFNGSTAQVILEYTKTTD